MKSYGWVLILSGFWTHKEEPGLHGTKGFRQDDVTGKWPSASQEDKP